MGHLHTQKQALLARVRRIAGQMTAIEKTIADDAACATILHQVAGVRGSVIGLMDELIEDHVRAHLARPGLSDADRADAADELVTAIRRYAK